VAIGCGAAVGALAGLAEVVWTYSLSITFPGRDYPMPASPVEFTLIAVAVDLGIGIVAGVILALVLTILRKVLRRSRELAGPSTIRSIVLAGASLYLLLSWCNVYHWFGTEQAPSQVKVLLQSAGVALAAFGVGWLIDWGRRRLTGFMPTAAWSLAVVAAVVMIAVRHNALGPVDRSTLDLPKLQSDSRPNILLVTLDTTRADYIGLYGHPIVKTPTLDALAKDCVVFDNAFAQAPTTTPSHCSIMTSTYVCTNRAVNGSAMRNDLPTIAEVLSTNGYQTAAVIASAMTRSANSGLNRGFGYYDDSLSPYFPFLRNDDLQYVSACYLFTWFFGANELRGDVITRRGIEWLEEEAPNAEPWFCWLHYIDPHGPFDAPEPYKLMYAGQIDPDHPEAARRARYGGEITYVDAMLGEVIDFLKEQGVYDDMLIVVTADHGQALGEEHGGKVAFGHSPHLYDSTQRVPLLVKLPGRARAGLRVKHMVQLIDLAPTILASLGSESPKSFQGKPFLDLLEGAKRSDENQASYAECVDLPLVGESLSAQGRRFLMTVRTPFARYVCDNDRQREELYDLVGDSRERLNIAEGKLDLALTFYGMLQQTLVDWSDAGDTKGRAVVNPSVKSQLKSLGYLGSGEEE
jgi:arylsulfatase A-like enzyme